MRPDFNEWDEGTLRRDFYPWDVEEIVKIKLPEAKTSDWLPWSYQNRGFSQFVVRIAWRFQGQQIWMTWSAVQKTVVKEESERGFGNCL
jgi:hypothetical protein